MWLSLLTNLMHFISSVWKRVPSDSKGKIRRLFQDYFDRFVERVHNSRSEAEKTAIEERAKELDIPISFSVIANAIERRVERFWQLNSVGDLAFDLVLVLCATFSTAAAQSIIIGWNLPVVFECCLMVWFLDIYLIIATLNRPVWGGLLCIWSAVLLAVFIDRIFLLTWIPSTLIQVTVFCRCIKICGKFKAIQRLPLMFLCSLGIAFAAASIGQAAMHFTDNRDLVLFRRWLVGDLLSHLIILVIVEICRLRGVPCPSLRWNFNEDITSSGKSLDGGTSKDSTLNRIKV